jgi:hypothetical protein
MVKLLPATLDFANDAQSLHMVQPSPITVYNKTLHPNAFKNEDDTQPTFVPKINIKVIPTMKLEDKTLDNVEQSYLPSPQSIPVSPIPASFQTNNNLQNIPHNKVMTTSILRNKNIFTKMDINVFHTLMGHFNEAHHEKQLSIIIYN